MDNKLSIWLAAELKKYNLSMRELARQADISHTSVADVVAGQRAPTWEFCFAIAKPLDKDPITLFKMAGLLSPDPPEVMEEREYLMLFRRLPQVVRYILVRVARVLVQEFSEIPEEALPKPRIAPGDEFMGANMAMLAEMWMTFPVERKTAFIMEMLELVEKEEKGRESVGK